ncbi:hypothetical protein [Thalassobaculum sp.]|uniref:hypothetical protein n=1 Tax=Thalassobaculum sp. TaxID=2022740 RepID=UPI0032EAC60F
MKFDRDRFVEDCKRAIADGQKAIREVVAEAVSDPAAVLAEMGEPERAGLKPLYRSPELTVVHFTWAPCMTLMPHNHGMFSVVGIYSGREDNIFWRHAGDSIEAAGASSLGPRDFATLGVNVIHSVVNPIARKTCAFHVYGGDFFDEEVERNQWDHEQLDERPWDFEQVKQRFRDAEERFAAVRAVRR